MSSPLKVGDKITFWPRGKKTHIEVCPDGPELAGGSRGGEADPSLPSTPSWSAHCHSQLQFEDGRRAKIALTCLCRYAQGKILEITTEEKKDEVSLP
jgi:hypothetical protein